MASPLTLAQNSGDQALGIFFVILYIAVIVLVIAGMWKVFEKAGQPGWGCLIPIYNIYLLVKIAGREWWWMLLMLIPLVGAIIAIVVQHDISKNFGRGVGTTLGLIFLPFIFYPILGFGDAVYQGPAGDGPDW